GLPAGDARGHGRDSGRRRRARPSGGRLGSRSGIERRALKNPPTPRSLVDTHILLYWLGASDRLTAAQREVLDAASPDSPVWVSEISLWEIATLVNLGRLRLALPLRDWLDRAV